LSSRFGVPLPTLRRLPLYYRRLRQAAEDHIRVISSEELGRSVGSSAAQVRKDLSYLPEVGRAGIGYDVVSLAAYLEDYLGLVNDKEAVLAGVGNLGRALALYPGFKDYGLQIVALFDSDVTKIGKLVGEQRILPIEKLTNLCQRLHIQMGIITAPPQAAQEVADAMLAGGIRVIWNFAPCQITAPGNVIVKNEDLATELATLSHNITRLRTTNPDKKQRDL
jgi:redox-sensing transcriptional repressor